MIHGWICPCLFARFVILEDSWIAWFVLYCVSFWICEGMGSGGRGVKCGMGWDGMGWGWEL